MAAELMLPAGYTYSEMITEHRNERTFHVKEITDEESAKLWLQKLSDVTFVTWRSLRGYVTNGTKVIFKHMFRCQHNQKCRNRPIKGKVRTIRSSKNTDCEAELVITVRRIKKGSRINPKDLALLKDYPTVVTFKRDHNHVLTSPSILKHRPLSAEVKDKICHLFKVGYSPSDALQLHKMDLQMEHGENYSNVAADGHLMPSVSEAYHLFAKVSKTEELPVRLRPKKRSKSIKANQSIDENVPDIEGTMFAELEVYLDKYQKETEGKARFQRTTSGNHYFVVICTPLMIRAHKSVKQSGEVVLVDAWGGLDRQKHRIYLMATPTAAGGVPLGVIVTDSVQESVFLEALLSLKDSLSDWGFYSRKQPQVILSDVNEINALREAFPDSKNILCQLRVLKAAWSWICDPTNKVEQNHRQQAFATFRKLLYSKDEATAEKGLWDVILFAEEKKCVTYGHYVGKLYEKREEWVSCFRKGLPMHGSNTNYMGIVVFRIIKDVIFNRTKTYNLLQLLDFIVKRYEDYMRHRLHDFSNGRYSSAILENMVPGKFDEANYEIRKTDNEFVYRVVDVSDIQENLVNLSDIQEYLVDLEAGICSCSVGQRGQFCEHSSAVILMLEKENVNTAFDLFCDHTKCFFVAEGRPLPAGAPGQKSGHQPNNVKDRPSSVAVEEMDATTNVEVGYGADVDSASDVGRVAVPPVSIASAPPFQDVELQGLWTSFETRMAKSIEDNPTLFKPALKQFFKNLESHCRSEEELATALYTFGTFWGKRKLEAR